MNHVVAHVALPRTVDAIRLARHTITEALRSRGFRDRDWLNLVALIVVELVSNAVRHAGGCTAVDLLADGQTIVAVTDRSSVRPRLQGSGDEGGRGLLIVDALCTRWGTRGHGTGKQVWAELPPCPGRSSAPIWQ
jgi:anti-sigma regulatory factor (Ser/Thr protein kinase)